MNKLLLDKIRRFLDDNKILQIFVVISINKSKAKILMLEKNNIIINTYGYIGKNGIGKIKEGDKKTPIGKFKFNYAFGIEDNLGCEILYHKITNDDWWSGDKKYCYNKLININDYPNLNKKVSEHLIDYKYEYRYCLNINYNEECKVGKGSAIFLHCMNPKKHYTSGCIAIPYNDMLKVMKNVKKDCIVLINSFEEIINL